MFTITPIGSCRITTPLRQGQDRVGFELNMNRCYGYCHSPAEAVQMAKFMLGQIEIPHDIWPLVSRSKPMQGHTSAAHALSDLYVIELSSVKEVSIDGVSIQLNYLYAAFVDFFADRTRGAAFWDVVETGIRPDIDAFLDKHWSKTAKQKEQSVALGRIAMRRVTQESLEADLRKLDALLPNVLIVSHVDACKPNGQKIASRSAFIALVRAATKAVGLSFCDPTDLMSRFGQAYAIEDESTGLAHFTPAFSADLMDHWARTVIAPLVDSAALLDEAVIHNWLVPQIVAACKSVHIFDAQKRLSALTSAGANLDWLAAEVMEIKRASETKFQKAATAAIADKALDQALLLLIEEADGLGRYQMALKLATHCEGGLSGLADYTLRHLAARAVAAGAYDIAAAFLRPVLSGQDDVAFVLSQFEMPRHLALMSHLGFQARDMVSCGAQVSEIVPVLTALKAGWGLTSALDALAFWSEHQELDLRHDPQLEDMIGMWVKDAVLQSVLSDRIAELKLILSAHPNHAAARDAERLARQALVVDIRAAGADEDLAGLNAMAPMVAKLQAPLPEFDLWRARVSFQQGDYQSAIELGNGAVIDMPDKINLWVLMMRSAHRLDQFEQAANFAMQVVRLSKASHDRLRVEAMAILDHASVEG